MVNRTQLEQIDAVLLNALEMMKEDTESSFDLYEMLSAARSRCRDLLRDVVFSDYLESRARKGSRR